MDWLFEAVDFLVNAVFAEVFALWFIVGLVIFIVGLLVLVLYTLSRVMSFRTTGTVVGAVEKVRLKKKGKDGEREAKKKSSLYPVYEYTTPAGKQRQMRGSEGGSMTLKYTTGQSVNLLVREDKDYDDVYDADEHGALYLGLGMIATGLILMSWVGSFLSAFGVGLSSILLALLGYAARAVAKRFADPNHSPKGNERKPYSKAFAPDDLHPIEHFQG